MNFKPFCIRMVAQQCSGDVSAKNCSNIFFIYFGWPSAVNLIQAKQKPTLFYNLPYKYEGKNFLIVVYSVGLRSLEDRGLFLAMGLMSRHGGQRPRLSLRRDKYVMCCQSRTRLCCVLWRNCSDPSHTTFGAKYESPHTSFTPQKIK